MSAPLLKVAFLVGADTASTRLSIERVCQLPGLRVVALLLDTERPPLARRFRNLRRNLRREGLPYLAYRGWAALRKLTDRWAERVIPNWDVEAVLRQAFPERCFSLDDLAVKYGIPIHAAGNLNRPEAMQHLRECDADLGVVLGTRILKRSTFGIPRAGCINIHKGAVPEYRGMPPGFWELYDGRAEAGVTVHFVNDALDSGDVIATSTVAIHPKETPDSLATKLDFEGARLLAQAVADLQAGRARRTPQPPVSVRPKTLPTRQQRRELAARLPHWRPKSDAKVALKNLLYLAIFHSGVYHLDRAVHRRQGSRGAVLLYHRVNDVSQDPLTTTTRRFAEHLTVLSRSYLPASTSKIVRRLHNREALAPTTVAIHFDDCYRDVCTEAGPILEAFGIPATAFVSSGYVDTDKVFAHDRDKYPHRFANLGQDDLRRWLHLGNEIGAHTVNHVDLGSIDTDRARTEIRESRRQLERLTGSPVEFFSFPFGHQHHSRAEIPREVAAAGYRAMFSAHGGFIGKHTDLFDIPRFGVSSDHSPLYLMMELEALTPAHFLSALGKAFRQAYAALFQ
ncbi:MAG: polysaccharide deacetylase family protein [Acidobacteria bacterium]|nr:polysaccharide deacetylase family protein [Acidobacteriota bacterium]